MKKNYFKYYFSAFGYLATLIVLAVFALLGFSMYKFDFLPANYLHLATGAIVVLLAGGALVGFTALKGSKIGMTDFIRINFALGGIELGIFSVLFNGGVVPIILYFVIAALYIIQVVIRFILVTEESKSVGIKAYFGALGFRYNPIVMVVLGMVVAVLFAIFVNVGMKEKLAFLTDPGFKFYLGGGILALVAVLLVYAMEDESDASVMDFLFAVVFLAGIMDVIVLATKMDAADIKYLVVALLVSGVGILARAIFYNKEQIYDNQRHKSKTYYKSVMGRYSMFGALLIAVAVIACVVFAVAFADTSSNLCFKLTKYFSWKLDANTTIMIGSIASMAILVALFVVVAIIRGFRSTDPVKTDWALVAIILSSAYSIPALIGFGITGSFGLLTANTLLLVAVLVSVVAFVAGVALQIIRIMNFDPMAALITASVNQTMAEKKEEKRQAEEAKAAAEKAEAEKKAQEDPFALTEEDEALYEATYGVQEKKEEPKEEEAPANPYEEEAEPVEEVQEEEAVEEETQPEENNVDDDFDAFLNSIPVKDEPKKEEPAPVEEAPVEETPVEEAQEETEEEDDADEDDEADEAEDYEDEPLEEGEEEVVEEHEHTKEADIQIQEYVAVDEDGKPKKIKRKFNTKMMFAPYETKEYYNEIKNYLMMYRAKGRNSSRCETFRYKGLVAKVALGGKAVKVFLALDPAIIEQYPKYHLKDFSEKKQYAEVPVMIKVRSDRSLKYFKELADLMFASRLVKPKKNYEAQNFLPQLIPNGEAILANLGMSTYYLQDTMNANGIPEEMPEDLIEYLPMIPGDELEEGEEIEAVAYLDTLCNHFDEGDEITLDVLKSMHICQKGNILRIKARGTLDRKLIIYAEKFDEDALAMLMCTNGTAVRIVR